MIIGRCFLSINIIEVGVNRALNVLSGDEYLTTVWGLEYKLMDKER
jgi:hypothetical protein